MQVTMFKGLLPVLLPDVWFKNPDLVRFAKLGDKQGIDFRPTGGKALAFWVEHNGGQVSQRWKEIENPDRVKWGKTPFAIESHQTAKLFGHSSSYLDLSHL